MFFPLLYIFFSSNFSKYKYFFPKSQKTVLKPKGVNIHFFISKNFSFIFLSFCSIFHWKVRFFICTASENCLFQDVTSLRSKNLQKNDILQEKKDIMKVGNKKKMHLCSWKKNVCFETKKNVYLLRWEKKSIYGRKKTYIFFLQKVNLRFF